MFPNKFSSFFSLSFHIIVFFDKVILVSINKTCLNQKLLNIFFIFIKLQSSYKLVSFFIIIRNKSNHCPLIKMTLQEIIGFRLYLFIFLKIWVQTWLYNTLKPEINQNIHWLNSQFEIQWVVNLFNHNFLSFV